MLENYVDYLVAVLHTILDLDPVYHYYSIYQMRILVSSTHYHFSNMMIQKFKLVRIQKQLRGYDWAFMPYEYHILFGSTLPEILTNGLFNKINIVDLDNNL